jgi:transcriptional regulator with PAS, ATPase and Fis domain
VSAEVDDLLRRVELLARSDVTVLVQGETGTGKELVASALHHQSGCTGRFVAVNCAALAEGVVSSELFGHVRGAFSDAVAARAGMVAAAAGGTLFLDEIGDANPAVQASLLRLLEQREYRPVGSDAVHTTDARFVAATHLSLERAVEQGAFRRDLFSRLDQTVVHVPPLRQRCEDVVPLALHFGEKIAGRPVQLDRALALALLRCNWPTNVRQLRAVVEQASLEGEGDELLKLTKGVAQRLEQSTGAPGAGAPGIQVAAEPGQKPSRDALRERLAATGGNVRALANELGVSRNTVYRWLNSYDLAVSDLRDELERKD